MHEYRSDWIPEAEFNDKASALGADGWELLSAHSQQREGVMGWACVFRRPRGRACTRRTAPGAKEDAVKAYDRRVNMFIPAARPAAFANLPYCFSDRSRIAVQLALQEALRCDGWVVGTQDLLLGLVKEGGGAAGVLANHGIDLRKVRRETEALVARSKPGAGPHLTERAKKALADAAGEAKALGCRFVGTEHVLLGLLASEGIGAQVLANLGVDRDALRREVLALVGGKPSDTAPPTDCPHKNIDPYLNLCVDCHAVPPEKPPEGSWRDRPPMI